jgi:hypothetical protein
MLLALDVLLEPLLQELELRLLAELALLVLELTELVEMLDLLEVDGLD